MSRVIPSGFEPVGSSYLLQTAGVLEYINDLLENKNPQQKREETAKYIEELKDLIYSATQTIMGSVKPCNIVSLTLLEESFLPNRFVLPHSKHLDDKILDDFSSRTKIAIKSLGNFKTFLKENYQLLEDLKQDRKIIFEEDKMKFKKLFIFIYGLYYRGQYEREAEVFDGPNWYEKKYF